MCSQKALDPAPALHCRRLSDNANSMHTADLKKQLHSIVVGRRGSCSQEGCRGVVRAPHNLRTAVGEAERLSPSWVGYW